MNGWKFFQEKNLFSKGRMDFPILHGQILDDLDDGDGQYVLLLNGDSWTLHSQLTDRYLHVSKTPECFIFRDDCQTAIIEGKKIRLIETNGAPVGVLVGPTVLVPETITVSFLLTSYLGVGLLIQIPDLCGKTAVYQITAINGPSVTLAFVSNEKGFDGEVGVYTPVFAIGFIPVVPPIPPNVSSQVAGLVGTGMASGTTLVATVISNPANPITVGQLYIFFSIPATTQTTPPSSLPPLVNSLNLIYGRITTIQNTNGVTVVTADSTALNGTVTLAPGTPIYPVTTTSTTTMSVRRMAAAPGDPNANPPLPGQLGPFRYSFGTQVGVVQTFVNPNTVVNPGTATTLMLEGYDEIVGSSYTVVQNAIPNLDEVQTAPNTLTIGSNVKFNTAPAILGYSGFTSNETLDNIVLYQGVSTSGSSGVYPATFSDSNQNTVTSTMFLRPFGQLVEAVFVNNSAGFSGTISLNTPIWLEVIGFAVTSGSANVTQGSITFPVNPSYFLPAVSTIVAVTSCQNVTTGLLVGMQLIPPSAGTVTLGTSPSPTANTNVSYSSNAPLYYGPNVQFNGMNVGTAVVISNNEFNFIPDPNLYTVPGVGNQAILYDVTTGDVIPIYITAIQFNEYTFNSLFTPLSTTDTYQLLWATPTLLGWVTQANSAFASNTISVSYATQGILPTSGTVVIGTESYTIQGNTVTSTPSGTTPGTGTLSIFRLTGTSIAVYTYAPILRSEIGNYPGLVAIGNYSFTGIVPVFLANEPLNLNPGLRPTLSNTGTSSLLTYNGSLANLFASSCSDGTFLVEFTGDVAPTPLANAPLWIQDSFTGLKLFSGYSTVSSTSLGGSLVIMVAPGFVFNPPPATGMFSFFDNTLTPRTFSATNFSGLTLTLGSVPNGITILPFTPIYQNAF
jgi:hypothetical protein